MRVDACTIVARNYLAAAHVLAQSFANHHPQGQFTVLVVDDVQGVLKAENAPFEILRADEIGIPGDELLRMAAIYTVMEFCTAVKPWLIKTLHNRGAESVLYLDPDVKVYGPLDELSEHARKNGIVLTPHVMKPLPRDGRSTSEDEILGSGIYNGGFIGVGPGASSFLEFWMKRLQRDCVVDTKSMRFVDQRWLDFVPALFAPVIEALPVYNVAYWNLSQRYLSSESDTYLVDGLPLKFFHFSGYDPRQPHLLSKHQGLRPRVLFSENEALHQICNEYGADLLRAGYKQGIGLEYGYARLSNGVLFDPVMRKAYRNALIEAEEQGREIPPNPLDGLSVDAFFEWLAEVPDDGPFRRLSRYLTVSYLGRPDLQEVFPDPDGDDFADFGAWSRHEVVESRLDYRLMIHSAEPPIKQDEMLWPGIRVAGYFRAETGVGELGRLTIATAREAGIEVGTYLDLHSVSRQAHEFEETNRSDLNVNLVCVNADQLGIFAKRVGSQFFLDRYTIGLWAWEIEEFPDRFAPSFEFADEIWTISDFARQAIAEKTSKPVLNFPLPIVRPEVQFGVRREDLGLPSGYTFLFCFDLMSVIERKNPFGLIEAFERAFSPGEGPSLVIKAVNSERKMSDLERLKLATAGRPDIMVVDGYLDAGKNAALMDLCDCYVSLHRSEGFGLTMGEAMALGKPVIATAYSGNLDFMTDDTSFLVPWSYSAIPAGCEPYREGARWAEPDIDEAVKFMRHVYKNPDEAALVGRHAQEHVLKNHGISARASMMAERFAAAQDVLAGRQGNRRSEMDTEPSRKQASGSEVLAMAERGPTLESPSRFRRASRIVRRLLLRVLRHHDEYQRELNVRLASEMGQIVRMTQEMQGVVAATAVALETSLTDLRSVIVEQGRGIQMQGDRLEKIESAIALRDDEGLNTADERT